MATAIIINKAQMGSGDEELGRKILGSCLRKLVNLPDLEVIVLYNAGAKLCTRDSPFATELTMLHERGIDILPCGTCVDFFKLKERMLFAHVSNMDEIVAVLGKADKVITL